jgi:hypothetical protein
MSFDERDAYTTTPGAPGEAGAAGATQPKSVSAALPQDDPLAQDPEFRGVVSDAVFEEHTRDQLATNANGLDTFAASFDAKNNREVESLDGYEAPAMFVRAPRQHVSQAPIDDLDEDEFEASIDYSHESNYTRRNLNPFEGSGYRRSRNDAAKFTKDLKYGRYLEVPKGRRDLFSAKRRHKTSNHHLLAVALIAVACAVIVVACLLAFA